MLAGAADREKVIQLTNQSSHVRTLATALMMTVAISTPSFAQKDQPSTPSTPTASVTSTAQIKPALQRADAGRKYKQAHNFNY